jgi:hypothetical protein
MLNIQNKIITLDKDKAARLPDAIDKILDIVDEKELGNNLDDMKKRFCPFDGLALVDAVAIFLVNDVPIDDIKELSDIDRLKLTVLFVQYFLNKKGWTKKQFRRLNKCNTVEDAQRKFKLISKR